MKKQSFFGVIVYLMILAALCGWLLSLFGGGRGDLTYSEVVELFQDEQVKSFTVQDDTIYLQLHSSYNGKTELAANLANSESFRAEMWELMQQQKEAGILESYDFIPDRYGCVSCIPRNGFRCSGNCNLKQISNENTVKPQPKMIYHL